MNITARTGGNSPQEVSGNDRIGSGTADPFWSVRGDSTWSVRTEPAADSLQPETTFDTLSFHPMMGCLDTELGNKGFQFLIRTCTGLTAKI